MQREIQPLISVYSIRFGGACPICKQMVHLEIHRLCVAEIAASIEDGNGILSDWESPLPGQFRALRPYILKQLARQPVLIHPLPSLSGDHIEH